MTQSQYSLAWDSFKSNICSGLSSLQQNGEFVDMTIAADGHFVKVHQVIVALASPYLKNLMASAPCQHPVIFLNNVPHKVLCYLLEYIYTGEVLVPAEYLASFTDAARELHIKGLESFSNTSRGNTLNNFEASHLSGTKRKNPIEIDPMQLPTSARKVLIKPEGAVMSVNQSIDLGDSHDYGADPMDESGAQNSDDDFKVHAQSTTAADTDVMKVLRERPSQTGVENPEGKQMENVVSKTSNLQYTVSIRGSLQVILNRYIYNLNSTRSSSSMRRWRCVDYKCLKNKCFAYIVTKGNVVVSRCHLHNHNFHDKKILAKLEKKSVFSAIDDVEAYKEKEKETTIERKR